MQTGSRAASAPHPAVRWGQDFRIHSFDVDFRRQASIETVCRFFLEAAWNHAESLGFGFSHLAAQGKLWVLSRLAAQVARYPRWGETVSVRTWPRAARSVFAMRDFQLLTGTGEILALGGSAWLVLGAQTRRPERAERVLASVPVLPNERALPDDPEKLPQLNAGETGPPFYVRYSDVDVNNHVNSCRYVRWLLDAYPMEFHSKYTVSSLEVNYLGETRAGEGLLLRSDMQESHGHSLMKTEDNSEVCRARIRWTA